MSILLLSLPDRGAAPEGHKVKSHWGLGGGGFHQQISVKTYKVPGRDLSTRSLEILLGVRECLERWIKGPPCTWIKVPCCVQCGSGPEWRSCVTCSLAVRELIYETGQKSSGPKSLGHYLGYCLSSWLQHLIGEESITFGECFRVYKALMYPLSQKVKCNHGGEWAGWSEVN